MNGLQMMRMVEYVVFAKVTCTRKGLQKMSPFVYPAHIVFTGNVSESGFTTTLTAQFAEWN